MYPIQGEGTGGLEAERYAVQVGAGHEAEAAHVGGIA
jgi:hypothetical protein